MSLMGGREEIVEFETVSVTVESSDFDDDFVRKTAREGRDPEKNWREAEKKRNLMVKRVE